MTGCSFVHHRVRHLPLLPPGPRTASASAAVAGSSVTPRRHAGRVRPAALRRPLHIPRPADVSDEEVLMLADILPTAYEVGVLNGRVQPG